MDASRWDRFQLRQDDIIIDTWSKAGTTLTQQIVGQLLFNGDADVIGPMLSPWLDFRMIPPEVSLILEAQTHRRFIKSHLPIEALPHSPTVSYLYIGRDFRDVIWSWHNHASNFTDTAIAQMDDVRGDHPAPARPDPDVRAFYNAVLADETLLPHPFWAHVRGWWAARTRPNVLLLHFARLIDDLPGQVRTIAAFLGAPIDESRFDDIIAHCDIDFMRRRGAQSGAFDQTFKGGAATFFNKGVNGRWRAVLSPQEIARADEIAARELPADCAHWLKTGEFPAG